jgi:putative hydrolase of the HAD superfamily
MSIRVVTFDVGGTILRVQPSVGAVYVETARAHGIEIDEGQVSSAFRRAWQRSADRGAARKHVCTDAILRSEWRIMVKETFGAAVDAGRLAALFDDLYQRFVSASVWRVAAGFHATLHTLRTLGVHSGILSNWDARLRPLLEQLGLLELLDFQVISHEVGYEKPHPAIFRAALAAAGAKAPEVLHVGDSLSADIEPARAIGMRTLWMASASDCQSHPNAGPGIERFPEDPAPFWSRLLTADP